MDRNTTLGFLLIMVVMVGYFWLTRKNYEDIKSQPKAADTTVVISDTTARMQVLADTLPDSLQQIKGSIVRKSAANNAQELVTIENEVLKLTLDTRGGRPYSVELKDYKRALKEGQSEKGKLILFEGNESKFSYYFATVDGYTDSTSDLNFKSSAKHVDVTNKDSASISMKIEIENGKYIEQVYTLKKNSYLVNYHLNLNGLDKVFSPSSRYIDGAWSVKAPLQEKVKDKEVEVSTIYYRGTDEEVDNIGPNKYREEKPAGNLHWISFKQQYFNATLINNSGGFESVRLETVEVKDTNHVKLFNANFTLPLKFTPSESFNMQFYFGPNKYQELKALDIELDRVIPLGWAIFRWVNKFLVIPVFNWLSGTIGNFGLVIIILTVIIKTLLLGLVYRSYISSAKMRILKPEMDAIKEKYNNDLQKVQQENMKLFRSAGVSPFGGCFPMLLQMPVLIAVFQFFPGAIELRQESFLWAADLSAYDSILNFGFKIPFYGDHVSLFTILMTISTLVYTFLNNQQMGMTGQMKYLSYIMPVFFLGFFNNYASGLTYYYTLSNLWAIGQQLVIKRFVDENALRLKIEANKKKPVKESAFQKRLQDMAKRKGIDPNPKKKK